MFFGESAFYGNIWIAQFDMPGIGASIEQHAHEHDHVSLLCSGSVSISIEDGPETIYNAPTIILIRKNLEHKITSLSDNTLWYCVFALRDINGSILDQFDENNLPNIDPLLCGNQSIQTYKILLQDAVEEINTLKLKYSKIETQYNSLKKRMVDEMQKRSTLIPVKNNKTAEGIQKFIINE